MTAHTRQRSVGPRLNGLPPDAPLPDGCAQKPPHFSVRSSRLRLHVGLINPVWTLTADHAKCTDLRPAWTFRVASPRPGGGVGGRTAHLLERFSCNNLLL